MRILFYSAGDYEKPYINDCNQNFHDIVFINERLVLTSASLAKGFDAISIFSPDEATEDILRKLHRQNVKYIAIRATGYDNVNLLAASRLGIKVSNVPGYSPESIAEHAVAQILALNRKVMLADKQVHQCNFTINNLVGFTLNGKTVGIIGTGKIGISIAKILHGFGCRLIAYDLQPDYVVAKKYDIVYTSLRYLCEQSDIITLHMPLTSKTKYLIDAAQLQHMKKGVMLINTARGAVVKTLDVIESIKKGHIGYYGMDVYENEKGLFFYDHSIEGIKDETLKELMSFPNVLITPHQAFATHEALHKIASVTIGSFTEWQNKGRSLNELSA